MKKFVIVMLVLIFIVFAVVGCAFFVNNIGKEHSNEESTSEMKEKEENKTKAVNKTEPTVTNETENSIENTLEEEINEEETKEEKEEEIVPVPSPSIAPNNSTETPVFLKGFENYSPSSNEVIISESKAKEIAQIGFEESKKRIASEGADDVDSQRIKIEEVSPNNYFTRKDREYDKTYSNITRKAYIVTRENDMGNGISIYVDATTGLIIGGRAFGD